MTRSDSIVMPISCRNEDCALVSAYRMFSDGSMLKIIDACWHEKIIPNRARIEDAWNKKHGQERTTG
jgi:hypothetical protein